jgi:hypothetical protein
MYRTEAVADEYNLKIPSHTLEDVSWKVVKKAHVIEAKKFLVSFDVLIKSNKEIHTFASTCAYIAGCMAWHINSSSIPIQEDIDNYVDVTMLQFKLM